MDNIEKSLYESVGPALHELAWHKNYPINPAIGLWGFFEGFRKTGFQVDTNDNERLANFILKNPMPGPKYLGTSMGYDEILEGWKIRPKSSPNSLYDSMHKTYDKIEPYNKEDFSVSNVQNRNSWYFVKRLGTSRAREKMEEVLTPYFSEHQEHMLLPVSGEIPNLKSPEIFSKVMKGFPTYILKNAVSSRIFPNYGVKHGPEAKTFMELDWVQDLEVGEYYPSENVMIDFFWGQYLFHLSEEKGYSKQEGYGGDMKEFVALQESALAPGHITFEGQF